jgi:hypothetical protein
MKDLIICALIGISAALVGWGTMRSLRDPTITPNHVAVQRGAPIVASSNSTSSSTAAVVSPLAASSTASANRDSLPSRFSAASGHTAITMAAPTCEEQPDGSYAVNFPFLAQFNFFQPDPQRPGQVAIAEPPLAVRQLDGRRITIRGYLVPLAIEERRITSFHLVRYSFDQCCFGVTPLPNEWILVNIPHHRAPPVMQTGVAEVQGLLAVGHEYTEDGQLISFYRMKAEAVWIKR